MGEDHINVLHARLEDVSQQHSSVGDSSDFDELFKIIHWPGWTTPVELALINELVDNAERAAQNAVQARRSLLNGARAIAEASVTA